jgi:hypothetical protein
MKKLLSLLLFTALVAGVTPMPRAQAGACFDRSHLVETLITNYGEQLAEVHEVQGRGLLEFHVSPADGTWTAVITDVDGQSCVLATGDGVDGVKSLHLEPGIEI